ncbi:hypothetical protein CK203_002618 [Vitis vinifera]|uniref:Uncharacterized protein n=1 Tax=Vitis vinifera TaxID=29760 RepID=A0A438KIB5_VITVI|nr:hypothetical protein CK203_002618 [Vitis vinifera]
MGRPSSTVEIPDKRHRIENGGHSPDSDSPRDHRRRRSPDYGRYDPDPSAAIAVGPIRLIIQT